MCASMPIGLDQDPPPVNSRLALLSHRSLTGPKRVVTLARRVGCLARSAAGLVEKDGGVVAAHPDRGLEGDARLPGRRARDQPGVPGGDGGRGRDDPPLVGEA